MTNTSSQFKKLLSHLFPIIIAIGLFGVSIWAISEELHKYHIRDVWHSVQNISKAHLLLALGLTIMNYFMLTGYDLLGTYYIKKPLPYTKTAFVSLLSYGISNSVGFALFSGSAIRYRFYKKWGLSGEEISLIIAFSNISFWIGLFAVGGVAFLLEPLAIPDLLKLPFDTVHPIGGVFISIVLSYLFWNWISPREIRFGKFSIPRISIPLSLGQIVITAFDWVLASGVLYILLLPKIGVISYFGFFGVYVLAQVAGIISHVPGGLGVFETIIILILSDRLASATLLGGLLAYRAIYYFFPLIVTVLMLVIYEINNRIQTKKNSQNT